MYNISLLEDPSISKFQENSTYLPRLFVVVYNCTLCFDELLSWLINLIRGPTISKLYAQTQFTSFYCLRLFVVVYKFKLVISVSINSHHGYQISL